MTQYSSNHYIICGDWTVIEKISPRSMVEFVYNYNQDEKYQHLRFGQAFLNKFYPGLICGELFYMDDNSKAQKYVWDTFVDYEMFSGVTTLEVEETE